MSATTVTTLEVLPAQNMRVATDVAGVSREIVLRTAIEIQGRKYVRVEGWMAIATAHGCVASSRSVEKVEGGYRAIGEIRRISDGALLAQAEGFVGEDESTWFGGEKWSRASNRMEQVPKRADYAIRAMVQTRAISRVCRAAFSHVVVMIDGNLSTTPAEEVPEHGFDDTPATSSAPKVATEAHLGLEPRTAKPTPAPETDDQKKARFLGLFKSYGIYATEVFRRDGLILDTEDYTDISAGKVASFTNNMVNALIKDVKNEAGAAENPELPEEEQLPVSIGNTIVPIPHKGQKRDDYIRKPDTIGSLYVAASDDREAANRLFGFMNNFQPKPWKDKFGKERPPGKSDIEFRAALDALARWREEKGIK